MEPPQLDSPEVTEPRQNVAFDEEGNRARIIRLRESGVNVWGSERVYISADVALDRLEPGAILFNAVIRGEHTSIGRNSRIGTSGQAVITNSQIGADVELGAGVYADATMLDHAKTRGFAEIRSGSLIEDQVEIGHNVGLKNTILTSAVVAGSCINFCDVFMTGGTSRSDHSEIGSGTVHFNFDPRGDKFGSLIGDARGVLLRFPRIFVGGNVGLVAPIHLAFGSVIPAGMTIRHDVAGYARSNAGHGPDEPDFDPEIYFDLKRKFLTTAKLTGNLHSLLAWYRLVRGPCSVGSEKFCCEAAEHRIITNIRHRVAEIERVIGKLDRSLMKTSQLTGLRGQFNAQHRRLVNARDAILSILLRNGIDSPPPLELIPEYGALRTSQSHVAAVRSLSQQSAGAAAGWLLEIGSGPVANIAKIFE